MDILVLNAVTLACTYTYTIYVCFNFKLTRLSPDPASVIICGKHVTLTQYQILKSYLHVYTYTYIYESTLYRR